MRREIQREVGRQFLIPMRIASWNVREIGRSRKRKAVKELVKRCKINIPCIQESKGDEEFIMRETRGQRLSKGVTSPTEGKSRSIMTPLKSI